MNVVHESTDLTPRETILHLIGKEIASTTRTVDAERVAPSSNADVMDHIIEDGIRKVKKLRVIREDLERIFYGEIE